jgi:hypothetical protein
MYMGQTSLPRSFADLLLPVDSRLPPQHFDADLLSAARGFLAFFSAPRVTPKQVKVAAVKARVRTIAVADIMLRMRDLLKNLTE